VVRRLRRDTESRTFEQRGVPIREAGQEHNCAAAFHRPQLAFARGRPGSAPSPAGEVARRAADELRDEEAQSLGVEFLILASDIACANRGSSAVSPRDSGKRQVVMRAVE
jgi:hypothetical protein